MYGISEPVYSWPNMSGFGQLIVNCNVFSKVFAFFGVSGIRKWLKAPQLMDLMHCWNETWTSVGTTLVGPNGKGFLWHFNAHQPTFYCWAVRSMHKLSENCKNIMLQWWFNGFWNLDLEVVSQILTSFYLQFPGAKDHRFFILQSQSEKILKTSSVRL